MARTVLLNCPIKAEIRAVDSQSDLTIFYSYDYLRNAIILNISVKGGQLFERGDAYY